MSLAGLVKISTSSPDAVQIWGFHEPCNVRDVASALAEIGKSLAGADHVINIMSGTHGCCSKAVGAVATREQKFADQDRGLANPQTKDGKPIRLNVVDFNTEAVSRTSPDPVTAAMSKLNAEMRNIVGRVGGKHTFLLAYCCSAGTR